MAVKKRKNSRRKGASAEVEFAKWLCRWVHADGKPVVASRMARNGLSAADIDHNIPGIHFEVKRNEKMRVGSQALRDAFEQARTAALATAATEGGSCRPVVAWRVNGGQWMITIEVFRRADDRKRCLATSLASDWMEVVGFKLATESAGENSTFGIDTPHADAPAPK